MVNSTYFSPEKLNEVIQNLASWVEKRPLILKRFDADDSESLYNSRNGLNRFTFIRPHREFKNIRVPTLCIVETSECDFDRCCLDIIPAKCHIGVITQKTAVSTFESRATVHKLQGITIPSLQSLSDSITDNRFKALFESRLPNGEEISVLSPKLSSYIIEIIASDEENRSALETAADQLSRSRSISDAEWSQENAIHTALAIFGLGKNANPSEIAVQQGASTSLGNFGAYILEDNVINRDASQIPGFSLIEKELTGRAIFKKGSEYLEVYTANRGPLEEMLGVDLIYLNEARGNIVMIQYKMLEETSNNSEDRTDWVFRPDNQAKIEILRMRLPPVRVKIDDYRLNPNPFYFKFIKRRVTGESPQSILMSLDHLKQFIRSPRARGSRGGIRVSYQALGGTYLRESDIISLIRSGYIGTHRVAFNALRTMIYKVSKGNRSLVLAWQRRVHQENDRP